MELLLDVPWWLHPLLNWIVAWFATFQRAWLTNIQEPLHHLRVVAEQVAQQEWWWKTTNDDSSSINNSNHDDSTTQPTNGGRSNFWLPVLAVLLVFWPVLLSLVMAIMTAGTWMFWLSTSILLGIVQFGYATYHFVMIAFDIFGLSLLKTYAVLRSQTIYYTEILLSHINSWNMFRDEEEERRQQQQQAVVVSKQQQQQQLQQTRQTGKTRRRYWRHCLEQAGTYENFLKIRIAPKDERKMKYHQNTIDSALPPLAHKKLKIKRTASFPERTAASLDTSPNNNDGKTTTMPSSPLTTEAQTKKRRGSFSGMFRRSPSLGSDSEIIAAANDESSGNHRDGNDDEVDPRVIEELGEKTGPLLMATTERLKEARLSVQYEPTDDNAKALKYLLSSIVKRNHLALDDVMVDNARSIAVTGAYGLTSPTRHVIREYYEEVEAGLDWLAEAPAVESLSSSHGNNEYVSPINELTVHTSNHHSSGYNSSVSTNQPQQKPLSSRDLFSPAVMDSASSLPPRPHEELLERVTLVRKMKQNMGRTALMLSGGGAQAMYHLGLIRAMIESKVYKDITVVSGTSGGSISAAMCAVKTEEELLNHVCVSNVSTDYMSNGKQKRQNIRWFPPPFEMASYWMKNKLLVDSAEFRRTCEFYYADITFEEAFERTGKHVCITVSASRASGSSAQRLLLNHISTPHVTIASAVAASCALPGVMAPTKLIAKNSNGFLETFEVDGVEWIDGSVQADLPFRRISTLFAVSSFIVSQTNFHVVPFLNKAHHPSEKSCYWRLFQTLEWDIRSRALKLSRLGLFPQVFGQDISKVFKQRYHGNLTIVPRFTTMQTLGLKVLANPSVKEMQGYLKYGQIATWPHLNAIRYMIRLERALDECLSRLEERLRSQFPGDPEWSFHDDVDSIASSSALVLSSSIANRVRIVGQPSTHATTASSTSHLHSLQEENQHLKQELRDLKKLLEQSGVQLSTTNGTEATANGTAAAAGGKASEREEDSTPLRDQNWSRKTSLSDGSEGQIWNMILSKVPKQQTSNK